MKKCVFLIFCFSVQLVLFGQNSTDSAKTLNSAIERMVEDTIYTLADEIPDFPGGDSARINFIQNNLKYPQILRDDHFSGGVIYIQFVVEKDGSLTNIKIKRGIGGGCDEECLRVVKLMPKWKPGKQKGSQVRVQYILPVKFVMH